MIGFHVGSPSKIMLPPQEATSFETIGHSKIAGMIKLAMRLGHAKSCTTNSSIKASVCEVLD